MKRVGVGEEKKNSKTECLISEIRELEKENATLLREIDQLKTENATLLREIDQPEVEVAPVQQGKKAGKAEKQKQEEP